MTEIRSKKEFYKLWELGVLGNRTDIWKHISEVPENIKKVGFRQVGSSGGGKWTLVLRAQAEQEYLQWKSEGRVLIMDGSVPNHKSIMQGEVCRTEVGLQSFLAVGYGLEPMRKTMAAGLHKHRGYLETRLLLERYMDPNSRDDLDSLLELYPDASVEFTCFDINVGNLPRRNTIFWETRNY